MSIQYHEIQWPNPPPCIIPWAWRAMQPLS